jgi:hypothetical protein
MSNLLDIYNLAMGPDGSTLLAKTAGAVAKRANAVLTEPENSPGRGKRIAWAKRALVDPVAEAKRMLWAVLGNATVQANGAAVADNDLEWVVGQLIDVFATEG